MGRQGAVGGAALHCTDVPKRPAPAHTATDRLANETPDAASCDSPRTGCVRDGWITCAPPHPTSPKVAPAARPMPAEAA